MAEPKTILVADDDIWFVQPFIEELLDTGFRVLQSRTGAETIEMLFREQVDLLILDIMMPPGNSFPEPVLDTRTGIKVAEFVRRVMNASFPIIYYTVISDPSVHTTIQFLEEKIGIVPTILIKPVLLQELVQEVIDQLGEP